MGTIPRIPLKRGKGFARRAGLVLMIIALMMVNLTLPANAAINAVSSNVANSSGAYSVTIEKPSGTEAGDVLVACIMASTAYAYVDVTPPPGGGWQLIRTTNAYQDYYYDMVTYYKIAGSSEPANYTWTSTYVNTSGSITRLTGVDIYHVVDTSADNQGKGYDNLVTAVAPSVTTSYANDIVLNFYGSYNALVSPYFVEGTYTPPLTALFEYAPPYVGAANDPPSIAGYNWIKSSIGDTGDRNCRLAKRSTSGGLWWVTQTIAFKAAPTVYLQTASSSDTEGTNRQVNLLLTSATEGPVIVNFSASGTATAGSDYTVTASPYTIPAGSTTGYLYIHSLPDTLYENDETVTLNITGATGAVPGGTTTHTHTIIDDEVIVPTPVITSGDSGTGVSPQGVFPPAPADLLLPLDKPDGLAIGDLMLAAISWHSASTSDDIIAPAGWVPIRTTYANGIRVATFYKIVTSGDLSGTVLRYFFSLPDNNLMWGFHATGGITRYAGVDLAHPVDVSAGTVGDVTYGNDIGAPSVNPNYSNDRIVAVFGTHLPVQNISAPTGMTERYEVHYHIDPNNTYNLIWPEIAVSDMTWAPASGTGVKYATVTGNSPTPIGISTSWAAQTIALKSLPQVYFNAASSSNSEVATTVNLPVSLSSPRDSSTTVNYAVNAAGTTALSGTDYSLASGTLTFAAGEIQKNIVLSVVNDREYELGETVQVTLSNPTGAVLGTTTTHTFTINDNDSNPTDKIVYQNTNGTNGGISGVSNHLLGIGKPAGTTNGDFLLACIVNRADITHKGVITPEGWTLIGTTLYDRVRVTTFYRIAGSSPGTDPDIYGFEIEPSFYVYEDHATGTIVRYTGVDPSDPIDLVAGAGAANASALAPSLHPEFDNGRLVTVFGSYVPVGFSTPTGMALLNYVHYHSGDTNPIDTWPATYVFDQVCDPASPTGTRASTLSPFGSHYEEWAAQSLVLHDAQPGIIVSPTSGLITTEAGGTASFTIRLNTPPTANVTIGLSSSDTTEGTVAPTSLTFTPSNWNTQQTVTITGVNDFITDGDIGYTIQTAAASSTDSNYSGKNAADVSVTNVDNDVAGITANPASGLVTTETGGTANFTIVLNTQPAANVAVALTSSDTGEGTVSPTDLTFTTANWNTPQNVTITGVDDTLADGDIAYTITALTNSTDTNYVGKTAEISVTNTDVEGTAPVVSTSPTGQTITYGANASFSAAAGGSPAPTVQWQVSTDGGSNFSNITNGGVYSGAATTTLSLTKPPASYSSYQYRAVFSNGINPAAISGTAALTVNPLGITGSFTAEDKVYNGTTAAVVTGRSLTGVLAGDSVSLTGGTAVFADKNVGTDKTVSLSGATLSGTHAGNYTLTSVATATADITPKSVVPSITADDKVYDGTTTAVLSDQSVTGVIAPEVVTLIVGSSSFADKDVGTWTVTATTLSLGGADAANYTLSAATATDTANITAYGLTISGVVAMDKEYDGNNTAALDFSGASLTGVMEGDTVSIDSSGYTAAFDNKNVGIDKPVTAAGIALGGADADNYMLTQPTGLTADITALGITGSFTADNKVYDGTTGAAVSGRSVTGAIEGDSVSLSGGTAAFADKNVGNGKTVSLSGAGLSGTDAGNYTLSSVADTTANIEPKTVTPWITADDKVYDGTTTAVLSGQGVTGVIAPEAVTLIVGEANFEYKDVGTWTVTATTLSLGGADAGNYTLSAATATDSADITAYGLTISGVVALDKEYDGNNTAALDFSGASLTGVMEGDSVSIDSSGYTAAFDNKNVGIDKSVTAAGIVLSGADAGNYDVAQPAGLTADITALGITGGFTADNKVYDGTTAAVVTGRSLTGVLPGDVVSMTGGTAAFDDKNVGTGKTVTLSGAELSGTDAGNYMLTSVTDTTADITPKSVVPSITADDKVYDGTTAAVLSGQGVTGVIASEEVTLIVGEANFADEDVGTWTVTATTLSLGGADAGNYALSAATATDTADITAYGLTISGVSALDKEYDGDDTAALDFSGASLTGVVEGDTVSIDSSGYSAAFDNKNVGIDKPVTAAGIVLSGADAGNYDVAQPAGLTADITALGITGDFTADNKVYDGTTAAVVTGRSLTGVLPGDVVSMTGGTAAFDDKNVGTGKTVTLSDAGLSGTDAGNYTLTSVADTTADITIREIRFTAVADTKTYDGSTSSDETPVVTSALGLADGDEASMSQTFDTKDVGVDKILTPAGTIDDGNDGNNYNISFEQSNSGVIEKATLTVTADDKTSQYSDARETFTASYSGFAGDEILSTSGVEGEPSYTTDPELSDPVAEAPGNYEIMPGLGTLTAGNYDFEFVAGTYEVTEEDVDIRFDSQNPVSVRVASDGGNNSAFTWEVIIEDDDDGDPADLSVIELADIRLSFAAVGSGGGWSGDASAFDPETGIATFDIPENVLGVETYTASVTLDNDCFTFVKAENVLVVYDPSLGFTTGGGWFRWPDGTANAELEDVKANFGFTMKYNKKGTGVQGSFLLIAHLEDDSIIRLKSNAIYGLAILDKTYPGVASFSGKCVYSRVDAYGNVIAESGNQEFTVYVKDMNEPGSGDDAFWFTMKLTVAGEDPFSLDSDGNNKADEVEYVTISGGNIVVPHNSSSAEPVEEDEETTPVVREKKK